MAPARGTPANLNLLLLRVRLSGGDPLVAPERGCRGPSVVWTPTRSQLGDQFLQVLPDLGPDAVHELLVHLAEHHGDRARVQAGDAALFNNGGEMDPRLPDHAPE